MLKSYKYENSFIFPKHTHKYFYTHLYIRNSGDKGTVGQTKLGFGAKKKSKTETEGVCLCVCIRVSVYLGIRVSVCEGRYARRYELPLCFSVVGAPIAIIFAAGE